MVSRPASGAAVDRYEGDRQRHTAIINFLGTTKDKRVEDESKSVSATTVKYEQGEYDGEYYYEEEYENGMSGDYEYEGPRGKAVTFSLVN